MSNKQKDSKWQKLKKEFYGTKPVCNQSMGLLILIPILWGM